MKKKLLVCLVLCLASVLGLFGLTACGDNASLADVKASYKSFVETYAKFEEVFDMSETHNPDGNLQWKLDVNLGENIDTRSKVSEKKEQYQSLITTYKEILEISNDYVMSNKEYIDGLSEKDLSNGAKDCLKGLNDALKSYKSEIPVFVKKMHEFNAYLTPGSAIDEDGEDINLQLFKKEYGKLVAKSITLSTAVANFVENTGVFKLIKNGVPTQKNFITLKNYIRIKLLPIFSRYKLNKIENVYNYYSDFYSQGAPAYVRVNNQLVRLEDLFGTFKTKLLTATVGTISGSDEDLTKLFNKIYDKAQDFFTEEADYFTALNGIDFYALAQTDYDSATYSAKNKNFLKFMDEIDLFLGTDGGGVFDSFIASISADFNIN